MRGRRFAVGLVVAVVVLTLAVGVAATDPVPLDPEDLTGEGTVDDPYEISNASELQAMEGNLSANYTLTEDVDDHVETLPVRALPVVRVRDFGAAIGSNDTDYLKEVIVGESLRAEPSVRPPIVSKSKLSNSDGTIPSAAYT